MALLTTALLTTALLTTQVRLVLAQKLLSNHKMAPMETLYFISPICILWMVPYPYPYPYPYP